MAQENLDLRIRAITEGMGDVARLINEVGSLRKEVDRLNSAGSGAGTGVGKFTNALDAQSKAVRNARQGTQQLGMQINDFATSVSTGASPVQAFNQQIGQVGYAMSMMGGKMGAVGSFLAGPWSILVMGAAMVLIPLITNMIDLGKSAEDVAESSKKVDIAAKNTQEAQFNLRLSLAKTAQAYRDIRIEMRNLALIDQTKALTDQQKSLARYNGEVEKLNTISQNMGAKPMFGEEDRTGLGVAYLAQQRAVNGAAVELNKNTAILGATTVGVLNTRINLHAADQRIESENIAAGKRADAAAKKLTAQQTAAANKLQAEADALQRKQDSALETVNEFINKYTSVSRKAGEAENAMDRFNKAVKSLNPSKMAELKIEIQAVKDAIPLQEFDDFVASLQNKALPDYITQLDKLAKTYANIPLDQVASRDEAFFTALNSIGSKALSNLITKYTDYGKVASQAAEDQNLLNKVMDAFSASHFALTPELQAQMDMLQHGIDTAKIDEKFIKIKTAFDDIGKSVADGFKGMITGAMSFGDAMKNILDSVINKLFEMYVVEQITGFITNALSGVFGIPNVSGAAKALTGKAIGGPVQSGGSYLVGERGPEMFVPSRSGSIIPNGGSSGMVINVDARGSADPAAVRAQVQAGILEAAPALIAAAEQRTITTLRRPRLGGVMQ